MIVLDTHIWVWWVNDGNELSAAKKQILSANEATGLGVSLISCWEVAKLVEKGRLTLKLPVEEWIAHALAHPGVCLLPLDTGIVIASAQLPQPFHNDPADQMIVATARILDRELATDDGQILSYPHVKLVWPS